MAPRFEPFAGLRYDPSIPLEKVIAPPYDIVGPEERAVLAGRHLANAIHVELPVDDPRTGLDRYQSAGRYLARWTEEGVVQREGRPAFYAYRMTEPSGRSSTGVIGALGCDPGGSDILPHEQTMPKDTTDRLDLLRACHANLSPIWGLSLTEGLSKLFEPSGPASAEATDDDGVGHALWVLDDPAVLEAISAAVAESPVVIADGHHRYHTALAYQKERRAAVGEVAGGYDAVMALVVELSEEQLSVGPIHRTLSGVPGGVDLAEAFGRWFDTVHVGPLEESLVDAVADSEALALVTAGGVWLLTPREETYREAGSDLDSSLIGLVVEEIPGAQVSYRHDWHSAVGAVNAGECDAAVLIRPVTVAQIGEWAHAHKRMPPKSTYFHPKPRTGMVYRPVEG
ncbi:MAG TPA: DUF1015 domain-containing protein [Acidimicrobiales bacterium]|nr:DUF1015 domain-containing protein [Acidimicrobiales bacterium]